MPRPKKRQMDSEEPRNTKKQKNTQASRRYSKHEEFNHKRCLAWFNEYTTPDDPHNLGKLIPINFVSQGLVHTGSTYNLISYYIFP